MSDNIVSLGGGVVLTKTPNATAVAEMEAQLERFRSGEAVGFGIVVLHHDGMSSWHIAGVTGGYSMVGAATVLAGELADIAEGKN